MNYYLVHFRDGVPFAAEVSKQQTSSGGIREHMDGTNTVRLRSESLLEALVDAIGRMRALDRPAGA